MIRVLLIDDSGERVDLHNAWPPHEVRTRTKLKSRHAEKWATGSLTPRAGIRVSSTLVGLIFFLFGNVLIRPDSPDTPPLNSLLPREDKLPALVGDNDRPNIKKWQIGLLQINVNEMGPALFINLVRWFHENAEAQEEL